VLSQPPPTSSRATPHRQPPPLCHDSETFRSYQFYFPLASDVRGSLHISSVVSSREKDFTTVEQAFSLIKLFTMAGLFQNYWLLPRWCFRPRKAYHRDREGLSEAILSATSFQSHDSQDIKRASVAKRMSWTSQQGKRQGRKT
jgi:hypothetical protein